MSSEHDLEALRAWADTKDRVGLQGLAADMPGVDAARKPAIIDWLLAHRPDDVAWSRQIEIEGLALAEHLKAHPHQRRL